MDTPNLQGLFLLPTSSATELPLNSTHSPPGSDTCLLEGQVISTDQYLTYMEHFNLSYGYSTKITIWAIISLSFPAFSSHNHHQNARQKLLY